MEIFNFFSNVKKSFRKVKKDMVELRNSVNEWIVFLNSNQKEIKQRLYELEKRVAELEMERVGRIISKN